VAVQLPTNVQAILTGQHEGSLDTATRSADRIYEAASQPMLASAAPNPDSTHSYRELRTSPARRLHSATSRTTFAPASKTLAPAPGTRAPAYTLNGTDRGNNFNPPAARTPAIPPSATPPQPPTTITRSGDHIHFPAHFNLRATISAGGGGGDLGTTHSPTDHQTPSFGHSHTDGQTPPRITTSHINLNRYCLLFNTTCFKHINILNPFKTTYT
jgi:hypothetical protein